MNTAPAPPGGLRRRWDAFADLLGRHGRRLTLLNLVLQGAIIVSGGIVRLSDSGLGCTQAPHCEPGQLTPTLEDISRHTIIEYGNRTFSALVVAVAAFTAVAVWRTRPDLKWLGAVPVAGAAAQAIVGIFTVYLHLNASVVAVHMLISTGLVWASVQLALSYRRAPRRDGRPLPWLLHGLTALTVAVVVLGALVTGSGPHSGDPAVTARLPFDLESITRLHGLAVWVFVGTLAVIVWLVRRDRSVGADAGGRDEVRRAWVVLVAATVLQAGIGYAQYLSGLPEVLVGMHLGGAAVLVAAQSAVVYLLSTENRR